MIPVFVIATILPVVLATPPTDDDCGLPSVSPNMDRIVGGTEATPYSWPWQVQARLSSIYWCGATVLSPNWIVTAAHCFFGNIDSLYTFHFGRHSFDAKKDPYEQVSRISRVIIHENYDEKTRNDIAVIRITPPIKYTAQVKAACLPTRDLELSEGTMTWTTGWGDIDNDSGEPKALMQVSVPIVDRMTCNDTTWYNGKIHMGMICAGYEHGGKDSCSGDSGGPLVAQIDGKWELYGVVSWGNKMCAKYRRPGVYADVVHYEDWIRSKIGQAEREEAMAEAKFRPKPYGRAFRELQDKVDEEEAPEQISAIL